MTEVSLLAGPFTEGDFRVGHVLNRAWSVLSGNFLKFSAVTGIAALPSLLLPELLSEDTGNLYLDIGLSFVAPFMALVLTVLSQAIVFHGAFQDMRGRPVSLADGLKVGLGRVVPVVGLGVVALAVMALLIGASFLPVVPGLIFAGLLFIVPVVMLTWSMAMPVCVVERLGPFRSLARSRALTRGHRLRILALLLLTLILSSIVGTVLDAIPAFGPAGFVATATLTLSVLWTAIWTAFFAIVTVVAYHDLRVAKEGVDTAQIAAVFE